MTKSEFRSETKKTSETTVNQGTLRLRVSTMEIVKRLSKTFKLGSVLAISIKKMHQGSLSDSLSWDSLSVDKMSGHNDKKEQGNEMQKVITHQTGTLVSSYHRQSSLYRCSKETPGDLEKTDEI